MMAIRARIALEHLLCEVHAQVFAQPLPRHPDELRALLEAMTARRAHMVAVALEAQVQTPDELRAALIADGTLPAGYEWPAGYVEP